MEKAGSIGLTTAAGDLKILDLGFSIDGKDSLPGGNDSPGMRDFQSRQ
jgi:hypothetical protein